MVALILFACLSILFSFLCSILEAVLLSVTPTFLEVKKKENKPYAFTLEQFKKDIDKPLIAILTVNTIAHTVGAIGVGSTAETAFGTGNKVVGVVSAIMTILILVVSEIIPKTIGAIYWKKLAGISTKTLNALVLILKYTGILWLLQFATQLIGKKSSDSLSMSREDFSIMTDVAEKEGVFHPSESKIVNNLLRFKTIQAKDIMTPRTVMFIAKDSLSIEEFYESKKKIIFSRIPVYEGEIEQITGFVLKDDILEHLIDQKGNLPLKKVSRAILRLPNTVSLPTLFERLLSTKNHIALLLDEYGSTDGLVTMEDVIETLIGSEIVDETDQVEDLQKWAREKWKKRAKNMGIIT